MCIFFYHSCSCHYGLFHSGVLSCIFFDTEILYSDIHSFGFILIFLLLTGKWFCGCYWVSPATSSSSFDFGCDCDRYFPALCLKHQQYWSIFLPRGFPQSQRSWFCPWWGWDEVSLLQLSTNVEWGKQWMSSLSLFEGMIQMVKKLPAMWDTRVQSLSRKDPLEKEMATHFSVLPGESHGQRRLLGYSPWGCKESDMTERLTFSLSFFFFWGDIYTVLRGPWGDCASIVYCTNQISKVYSLVFLSLPFLIFLLPHSGFLHSFPSKLSTFKVLVTGYAFWETQPRHIYRKCSILLALYWKNYINNSLRTHVYSFLLSLSFGIKQGVVEMKVNYKEHFPCKGNSAPKLQPAGNFWEEARSFNFSKGPGIIKVFETKNSK